LSSIAKISDSIQNKIKVVVKDKKERQLLYDLLECEIAYLDMAKPDFRKDFKMIIEQRFPYSEKKEDVQLLSDKNG